MARPPKDGMDYFPHDTDASNDEKVEALRVLYGNDGYAFYFILLERIYRTNEAELDVSDAETIQILARKVAVTAEKFLQILETALKWKCFDRKDYEERGVLTSNGIKKRASVVVEKRVNMREKYQKKKEEVSDAETGEETTPETPQSKEKKRKEKESKNIYSPDFETFYNTYPNPANKMQTFTNWKAVVKKYGHAEILRTAERYDKECRGKDRQYIVVSSNFVGKKSTYLDYLDENYTPKQDNRETRVGVIESDSDLGPREDVWM